jgi:hypothetical protein
MLDVLRQDLRLAFRSLLRAPAFAIVIILTLALGIGANTAIFSIVNGVILRPLGYPQPEQLMYLTTQFPAFGFDQFWVSPPEYFEFREMNQSFSAVGAYTTGEVNLTAGDRPLRVRSAAVDDRLLAALGLQPLAGRLFALDAAVRRPADGSDDDDGGGRHDHAGRGGCVLATSVARGAPRSERGAARGLTSRLRKG